MSKLVTNESSNSDYNSCHNVLADARFSCHILKSTTKMTLYAQLLFIHLIPSGRSSHSMVSNDPMVLSNLIFFIQLPLSTGNFLDNLCFNNKGPRYSAVFFSGIDGPGL